MTHPLTDEMCYQMSINNMETYGDLRDAADWQLQKVLEFMKKHEQMFGGSGMIFILEDAMRPQQHQEDD